MKKSRKKSACKLPSKSSPLSRKPSKLDPLKELVRESIPSELADAVNNLSDVLFVLQDVYPCPGDMPAEVVAELDNLRLEVDSFFDLSLD